MKTLKKYLRHLGPWIAPLAVLLVAWSLGKDLLQETPLTRDHPTHIFKAWHFYEKMLPELRLRGFSHYWVFGFPAGELVPFGEELWVSFFRAITFEQLTWLKTYSLSLLGLIGLIGLSGYYFGKQFFGATVGFITALLILLDRGAWAQAGWFWFMEMGVWPNSMGIAFLLLSIAALDKLGSGFSKRRFIGAALLVMAALMSHQIAIPFLPLFLTLLFLDRWVRKDIGKNTIKNILGATAVGALLSAFYVVPMVARATALTLDLGVRGVEPEQMALRIFDGQVFERAWSALIPLGFVGAFLALKRKVPGALFLSVGTGLFVFGATDVPFSVFHLERVMPSLRKIEATRLLVGAKYLWFPLVAYALAEPLKALWPHVRGLVTQPKATLQSWDKRWLIAWTLAGLVLSPYAKPFSEHFYKEHIEKKLPQEELPFRDDLFALLKETKKLRAASDDLYRVVYDLPFHDHLSTIAPVYDDGWMYKVGYTPTQAFWAFPMSFEETLFQKLMTKYVVSHRVLPPSKYKLRRTFGKLHLYDFVPYQEKPFSIVGAGSGKLEEFSSERIQIHVKGATKGSRLQLFVSKIDHFVATVNGRKVPISPATIRGAEDPFLMEIPVESGKVTFEYVPRAPDIIGKWATLLVIPVAIGYRSARRKESLRKRLGPWLERASNYLNARRRALVIMKWASLLLVALSVTFVAYRRITTKQLLVSPRSIFRDVPAGSMKLDGKECRLTEPFMWKCGKNKVFADRVAGLYGTHLCMTTAGNHLELSRKLPLSAAISGRYDTRPGHGHITVSVGESTLPPVRTRGQDQGLQFLRFDTRSFRGKAEEVTFTLTGAPLHCFDFEVAE